MLITKSNNLADRVSHGNVQKISSKRGWFIGHFIRDDPFLATDKIEAKWGIHRISKKDKEFRANRRATSMSILLHGRIRFEFVHDDELLSVLLKKPGDYVVWRPTVHHRAYAVTDRTQMLTLRWPSIKGDHYRSKLRKTRLACRVG